MLVDLLGWLGAVCILVAYYLISTKKVKGNSTAYQLLNLVGGLALVFNTYSKGAWPAAVLNIVWAIIAVKTLLQK